jgi:sigma-B regulation protein RsbU (phosphoserine phosphatase)
MAASEPAKAPHELSINTPSGQTQYVTLERDRYALGRASTNEFTFPEISFLSREHLAFERDGTNWVVRDLGSRNGTFVNETRIVGAQVLRPNDVIRVGPLRIVFDEKASNVDKVIFVENPAVTIAATTSTTLKGLLSDEKEIQGSGHMHALIRAGRELAGHMPLEKLFDLILHLSVEAVGATRGALMTLEDDELLVRATRGYGFRISSHVRDLVLKERRSLLIRDALSEEALAGWHSIVEQRIRSMLAVPLQTEDRVIGLIYLDSPHHIHEFTREDLNLLTVMSNIAAVRIENARLTELEQAERVRAKELEHAALIQHSILPGNFPPFPHRKDFELHAAMIPAREVGGDLFDFFLLDEDHLGFVIGDVSGKGVPAALFMAVSRTLLRATAQHHVSPGECLSYVNSSLAEQSIASMFVTLFYGVLDTRTGEVQFANGGHNPPYIFSADGKFRLLPEKSGPMVGVFEALEYRTFTTQLMPGEGILLYTDGVTDAMDKSEEFFGEQRLEKCLAEHASNPVADLVHSLHAAIDDFSQQAPRFDDVTVLALRYLVSAC